MGIPHVRFLIDFELGGAAAERVERFVTAAWKLMTELRALAEDVDGAAGEAALIDVLGLRIAETLVEIDLDLAGIEVAEEHHLAIGLERGLRELAFGVADLPDFLSLADPDAARLKEACASVIEQFSSGLPDPLAPNGQGPMLRAMRSWSRLGKETDADLSSLVELVKSV